MYSYATDTFNNSNSDSCCCGAFRIFFYHAANKNKQHMRKKPQITSEPNTRSVFIKKQTQPHLSECSVCWCWLGLFFIWPHKKALPHECICVCNTRIYRISLSAYCHIFILCDMRHAIQKSHRQEGESIFAALAPAAARLVVYPNTRPGRAGLGWAGLGRAGSHLLTSDRASGGSSIGAYHRRFGGELAVLLALPLFVRPPTSEAKPGRGQGGQIQIFGYTLRPRQWAGPGRSGCYF